MKAFFILVCGIRMGLYVVLLNNFSKFVVWIRYALWNSGIYYLREYSMYDTWKFAHFDVILIPSLAELFKTSFSTSRKVGLLWRQWLWWCVGRKLGYMDPLRRNKFLKGIIWSAPWRHILCSLWVARWGIFEDGEIREWRWLSEYESSCLYNECIKPGRQIRRVRETP